MQPTRHLALLLFAMVPLLGHADPRSDLLDGSLAHWSLGAPLEGQHPALKPVGRIETAIADGPGALPGARIARLSSAWFDAGKSLSVGRDAITVYLRARDPRGLWSYALFAKRGSHETVHFNLFCIDLHGRGPEIGFELHAERGFVLVSFPVSLVDKFAWHDLVGRYDGQSISLYCDGRLMARQRFHGGKLTTNDEPILIGGETDQGKIVRPFTGEMEEAAIFPTALSDAQLATLCRVPRITPGPGYVEPFDSPIHYRPDSGRLADTIPFFWKGQYHIFYLRGNVGKVPWEHIVSTDLLHWKELPTALVPDGDPDGPDGENMFTGSVIEHGGTFHIFYTGWNPRNPAGREWIMHATSSDLVHWTKHPADGFCADGVTYDNSDFRDPYVFYNEQAKAFWMVLCARDAKTKRPVQGLASSTDLVHWKQLPPLTYEPPLGDGTPECPDLFRVGDTWHIIHSPSAGTTDARLSTSGIRGPYRPGEPAAPIDTPILYAAKRMYDGRRHILTGWLRDLSPERDNGAFQWGGVQCLPREVYAGADGQLRFRPAAEVTALFSHTVFDLASHPRPLSTGSRWAFDGAALLGEAHAGSQCTFDAPPHYMLDAALQLDPAATFALVMREQPGGEGYRLTLRPQRGEAELSSPAFRYARRIPLDATRPIHLQAFVQGSVIECFINDASAFSCRAYNYANGVLGLNVAGGRARLLELKLKTPPQ